MFYSVTGTLVKADNQTAVIECGGVAFKCFVSAYTLNTLVSVGEKQTLYTYLSVKEDALDLFGFTTESELDCFKLLISVSGVGPKGAIAVLSELDPKALATCIMSGDSKSIQRAQGIGAKTAQRVVLELHDKVSQIHLDGIENIKVVQKNEINNASDAVAVLVSIGYSNYEASAAVGKLDPNLPTEQLIKDAMAILARG